MFPLGIQIPCRTDVVSRDGYKLHCCSSVSVMAELQTAQSQTELVCIGL